MSYVKKTDNPNMGRPPKDNPKATQLAVRLDDEMLQKLDAVATLNSESRVQTLRRGIEKLYSEIILNSQDHPLSGWLDQPL